MREILIFLYNNFIMRLDKFLKVSRLIKRRTVANEVSTQGRILVNGNVAKPSKVLKEGDTITIESYNKVTTVKVTKIPTSNMPGEYYEVIE